MRAGTPLGTSEMGAFVQVSRIESVGPTRRVTSPGGVEWDVSPVTRDDWEAVVDAASDPHLTQTPVWMDVVVEATGGRNATRVYRSSDGRRMVLPLIAKRAGGLTTYGSLLHGWGRGGIVADGPIDRDATDVVLDDVAALGGARTRIRVQPELDDVWGSGSELGFTAISRITHIADLSRGFDHLWSSVFSGSTRTKIRKAAKSGVEIEERPGGDSISTFYEIYEAWVRDRAERRRLPTLLLLPIGRHREPRRKFVVAAQHLPHDLRVWVAKLEGRPVAAAVQLIYGVHSVYWRGYGLRGPAGRSRATYALQSRMMEEACRAGCRTHDMGESGGVESLMRFKEVFGATPRPYRELSRDRLPFRATTWRSTRTSQRLRARKPEEASDA